MSTMSCAGRAAAARTPCDRDAALIDGDHLLDASRAHLQFAAAAKVLQALVQLRRQPVPIGVPVHLQMPHKAAPLGFGHAPPQCRRQTAHMKVMASRQSPPSFSTSRVKLRQARSSSLSECADDSSVSPLPRMALVSKAPWVFGSRPRREIVCSVGARSGWRLNADAASAIVNPLPTMRTECSAPNVWGKFRGS